jgi:hypothetical protein
LRGFNFREKLEEKNKRSRKCFVFLNKWCKTKNQGMQSAKNIDIIVKELKLQRVHLHSLTTIQHCP